MPRAAPPPRRHPPVLAGLLLAPQLLPLLLSSIPPFSPPLPQALTPAGLRGQAGRSHQDPPESAVPGAAPASPLGRGDLPGLGGLETWGKAGGAPVSLQGLQQFASSQRRHLRGPHSPVRARTLLLQTPLSPPRPESLEMTVMRL